jgi:hypothetical protein
VEDELLKQTSIELLLNCFMNAKGAFFHRLIARLTNHPKAVVRLSLLRLLWAVCDVHPGRAAVAEKYRLVEIVEKVSRGKGIT